MTLPETLSACGLEQFLPLCPDFERLTDALLAYNEKVNLTAVRDREGVYLRHIADSLMLCDLIPSDAKVVDVGCGGGFPCLPLAVARRDVAVTALDSTAKKLTFVRQFADSEGLHLRTVCGRAEELGRGELRGGFHIVTARGVCAMKQLVELCLPLLRTGGCLLAMKNAACDDELAEAAPMLKTLGGVIDRRFEYALGDAQHAVIVVRKVSDTPAKYPRPWSAMCK